MKTVIEMAIEAGIDSWWDSGSELREVFDDHLTRFATLVKAAHVAELLEGVEMPEPSYKMANLYTAEQLRSTVAAAVAKKDAEIEMLRLQIAACGVAAMQNTETYKPERLTRDNMYWSASYGDVCRAVDAEIALRAENERLRDALQEMVDEKVDYMTRNNLGDPYKEHTTKMACAAMKGQP